MDNSVNMKGTIFKIKRFAVHDGPGIRTAIFLKGCPLNCIWCHSPEGIDSNISLWYNRNTCILCNSCVKSCPEQALTMTRTDNGSIYINRLKCNLSGECVAVCSTQAMQFSGESITITEIVEEILKDRLFYENSGGGITITGGEPLFQPEFTLSILKNCKKHGIQTAIETSLFCETKMLGIIAEYVDLFIVDMKIADSDQHRKYTGKSNESIRKNFSVIAKMNKNIIVRIPLIPEITDSKKNTTEITEFVNSFNRFIPIEYLDYNPLAENNYKRLDLPFLLTNRI